MSMPGLSAQLVRTAKPGRYGDGDGLYLLVKKSGARFRVFRYKVNGSKLREAGLGRAGEGRNSVRLAEARDKASILFRQVKSGIDPLSAREAMAAAAKAAAQDAAVKRVTFREAAQRYIDGTRLHGEIQSTPRNGARQSKFTPIRSSGISLWETLPRPMS
jgi:Arm domain-containing DNA-binding protein